MVIYDRPELKLHKQFYTLPSFNKVEEIIMLASSTTVKLRVKDLTSLKLYIIPSLEALHQ